MLIYLIIILIIFLIIMYINLSPVRLLINNAIIAYCFKEDKKFTNIIFKNPSDLIQNMDNFIGYAFPKLDKNEINKILNDNGIMKTMDQIFEENKNLSYTDFNKKFNIMSLLYPYKFMFFEENYYYDYGRLWMLTLLFLNNIYYKESYNNRIFNDLYSYELSSDFKTSKISTGYLRTKLNKGLLEKYAIDFKSIRNDIGTFECFTNKLCKNTSNLKDNYNKYKKYKEINNNVYLDGKRFFNLSFALNLFRLNGTEFPTNLNDELTGLNRLNELNIL